MVLIKKNTRLEVGNVSEEGEDEDDRESQADGTGARAVIIFFEASYYDPAYDARTNGGTGG
jgi:hypothetical protein